MLLRLYARTARTRRRQRQKVSCTKNGFYKIKTRVLILLLFARKVDSGRLMSCNVFVHFMRNSQKKLNLKNKEHKKNWDGQVP